MSEPLNTPAQAPAQAPTPPVPQQQAPQNQPPQQAAPTPPVAPPPTGTPPATPPAVVQPSPELLAMKAERDQLAKNHQEAMRKITQQGQQLAQLVGAQTQQPAVDHIAPYVKMLVDKGYAEKDARDVAEVQWAMLQPALQAQQQTAMATQGMAMVQDVMREAWTEMPAVFASNPNIGNRVEQVLRGDALAGRPIDKEYALNIALIEEGRARYANPGQQPPPQQLPPSFQSMYAPPNGFAAPQPQQQAAPQLTAEQQKWNDDFQKLYPKKTA